MGGSAAGPKPVVLRPTAREGARMKAVLLILVGFVVGYQLGKAAQRRAESSYEMMENTSRAMPPEDLPKRRRCQVALNSEDSLRRGQL